MKCLKDLCTKKTSSILFDTGDAIEAILNCAIPAQYPL